MRIIEDGIKTTPTNGTAETAGIDALMPAIYNTKTEEIAHHSNTLKVGAANHKSHEAKHC